VGFTIAACGFVGGTISGASMNPARSLAPQVFAGDFSIVWIYLAGPCLGAFAATAMAPGLFGRPDRKERNTARGE
jgi:aquaporin Z